MPKLPDMTHNCIGKGCKYASCENQRHAPAKPRVSHKCATSYCREQTFNVWCAGCVAVQES